MFIPLYPIGVAAEMGLIWMALPYIKSRDLYSLHMPNSANFGFSYLSFCQVITQY
jgi:very-long-chain (3R)-3-hydroxyacyl-CoA dehydratase